MKNLSKVLAVVLALVMALSMVSFAAYTDVADDANYAEAVSVLSSLEMLKGYEDGTFKPEGEITRAEFAMVVCRLLGYGASAENTSATNFADVPADHWASGAIALAASQGIVNGYGNGNFGPEDPVKYEEAIKMVVCALGYGIIADGNGGYPGGHQIAAAQAGLLDDITDGKSGVAASRAVVAQLAYNALEVPMMAQDGFGSEVSYNYTNVTLLNKIGVVKLEAKITGTAKTTDDLKANEIAVAVDAQWAAVKGDAEAGWYSIGADGVKPNLSEASIVTANKIAFDADSTIGAEAEALLDYEVNLYVKDATTRNAKLVAIAKKDTGYTEVAFATEDINMEEGATVVGTTIAVFVDEDKDEYEEYDLNDTVVTYVNGRTDSGYTLDNFTADDAEADIKLLDSDGDEDFDVAYITTYVDYVVNTINARNYRIIAKDFPQHPVFTGISNRLVLDEENEDYSFEIIKDGKVVDFSAIAENDVLSVAGKVNESNELVSGTVIINTQSVTGTINGDDIDENILVIDDVEYKVNDVVATAYNDGDIELGDAATFYVNARGILCGLDEATKVTNLKYGFITNAMPAETISGATMDIRMMDAEGVWNTYALAAEYDLNGEDAEAANFATDVTPLGEVGTVATKYVYNMLVGYELNADGEIKALYTEAVADEFVVGTEATNTYNADTEMWGSYSVPSTAVIFTVPEGFVAATEITAATEKNIGIASADLFVDRESYTMTAYGYDEDLVAPVFLGVGVTGRIDMADDFMVITSISTRTNNGVAGKMITGLVNGEEVKLFAATEENVATVDGYGSDAADEIADLAKGDVILYSVDAAGNAASILRLMSGAAAKADLDDIANFDETLTVGTTTVAGQSYTFYYGYVAKASASKLTIIDDIDAAEPATAILSVKGASIITEVDAYYQGGKGQVVFGDAGSFLADSGLSDNNDATGAELDGDIVFVKAANGTVVTEAVVYKANQD